MVGDAETVLFQPGRNCFEIATADRMAVIIDADDYFRHARAAMIAARKRIVLIGWDFDARIALGDGDQDDGPQSLGDFILWLVERTPDLEIFLLRWDIGAVKTLFRGTTVVSLLKWMAHPRIHIKFDHHHPTASSHHQKIVVVDECLAFCGGIDMFTERWDTREHAYQNPRRSLSGGKTYKPWHDATSALTGPVVKTISKICRDRWHQAGGKPAMPALAPVGDCWPDGLDPMFSNTGIAVARTIPELKDRQPVHEIEALYLDMVGRAKKWIYAESQYFASRRIAEAIAARLRETGGPEIVIVNPQSAEGWLEPVAMDTARARLIQFLRSIDHENRFRMYHPYNDGGEAIYVHAKVSVFDDTMLRIGSANMNNRSMRLDTECDIALSAGSEDEARTIAAIRKDLLAEHLGCAVDDVAGQIARTGSLIETVETLRGSGHTLEPYTVPDLPKVKAWLADNEIMDPEGPAEMFEKIDRRGLFRGWSAKLFERSA